MQVTILSSETYPAGREAAQRAKLSRFAVFTWSVLVYNLFVVLWGAYVRASGSGAGCGSHWPLCNGEVVPRLPQIETLIELTHRLTSGLALALVVVLVVWAFRAHARGHVVRTGAVLSLVFILTEALIGAGLVIFEHVADNASVYRVFSLSAHLVNTFVLLGALALTAWWATTGGRRASLHGRGTAGTLLLVGMLGTMLVGVSGAVAALGDTLFPASSLAEGLRQDFSSSAHVLVRLRVLHPFIAVGVGLLLVVAAALLVRRRPSAQVRGFAFALVGLVVVQLLVGLLNVALLAPIWLQLVHLLLADLLWLSLALARA